MKIRTTLFVLFSSAFFTGCVNPGAQEPIVGPHCTINVPQPKSMFTIMIAVVDKASVNPNGEFFGYSTTLTVSPGFHVFSVRYSLGISSGFERFDTKLEADHTYTLCSKRDNFQFVAWLTDDSTGIPIEQKVHEKKGWKKELFGKFDDE
jgi:hypothetical protein